MAIYCSSFVRQPLGVEESDELDAFGVMPVGAVPNIRLKLKR
jgi:hypothetical protein